MDGMETQEPTTRYGIPLDHLGTDEWGAEFWTDRTDVFRQNEGSSVLRWESSLSHWEIIGASAHGLA